MNDRINQAPCGYLALTPQGTIRRANRTFLELVDYEKDELAGLHIEVLLTGASRIIFHTLFYLQLSATGRVEEIYLTFRSNTGRDVPLLLNGRLVEDREGAVIDCVVVRMTKRDDYEQELRQIRGELEEAYRSKNEALRQEKTLRELFETTLFAINEAILVTDGTGRVTRMNGLAEALTGWTEEAAAGRLFADVFRCLDARTRQPLPSVADEALNGRESRDPTEPLLVLSRDGTERLAAGACACVTDKDGAVAGTVTSFRDITKEYLQEKAIDHFLLVNMDMLCVLDGDWNLHKANHNFQSALGYSGEELLGRSLLSFVHGEDAPALAAVRDGSADPDAVRECTVRFRAKDGGYRHLEWRIQSGMGTYAYASARDVTEKVVREKRLKRIAEKDELTGLYNRHYLTSVLDREIGRAERGGPGLSLAILDLDRFKRVNDTWGHPVGDSLLKHTAKTVLASIRQSDLLIRFGGEEFVLLMPDTPVQGAVQALEKVRLAVSDAVHPATGRQTVSVGVAERRPGEPFEEWYARADQALYRAKQEGRDRVVAAP